MAFGLVSTGRLPTNMVRESFSSSAAARSAAVSAGVGSGGSGAASSLCFLFCCSSGWLWSRSFFHRCALALFLGRGGE